MDKRLRNIQLGIGALSVVCFGQIALVGCSPKHTESPSATVKQAPNQAQESEMIQEIQGNPQISQGDKDAQINALKQQFAAQQSQATAPSKQ